MYRLESVFTRIPNDKRNYFHTKSLANFVYHLKSIDNNERRSEVSQTIGSYLDEVEELLKGEDLEPDMELSEYLFKKYLPGIIKTYDVDLRFVPVPGKKSYILVIPATIIIFYLLWGNQVLFVIFSIILILNFGRIALKARKRKLYGFGY
ncbi:hypothetical protein ACX0G7_26830 [Flavitalea antarctica]